MSYCHHPYHQKPELVYEIMGSDLNNNDYHPLQAKLELNILIDSRLRIPHSYNTKFQVILVKDWQGIPVGLLQLSMSEVID